MLVTSPSTECITASRIRCITWPPSMYSRRDFAKTALAGVGWALASPRLFAAGESRVGGVYIGIQTFSLRALPREGVLDALVAALTTVGLTECELFQPHAEPPPSEVPAADLPKWRQTVPLDYFRHIRGKFNKAGIEINAYNPRINMATDEEIDRQFEFAKALGAKTLNAGVQPPIAPRVAHLAEKHKMPVAITQPNPDILEMSKYFRLCFDIGDSTRAGNDAFAVVREFHDRLADIHLKDCKFKGPSVPFGEGDSKMKEVLQFLKQKRSPVRVRIDCDYPGTGSSVEEVQKCVDYVKAALR
jgi:sugar phosphate isomerase/epimerase